MTTVVPTDKLIRGPKGLRLEAKCAYRDGQAMLTVYGFWIDATYRTQRGLRCVLQRVFVSRAMPKAERRDILRAMCDLIAVERGVDYYLRSKL